MSPPFPFNKYPIQKAAQDSYSVASGSPLRLDMTSRVSPFTISSASISVNKSTSPALSFGNVGPTSESFTNKDGDEVAIGKAVQADCDGGKAGENYIVTVVASLSNGSARGAKFWFHVR